LTQVRAYVDGFNLYYGLREDTALVISADSDLCPAIRSLKRLRPNKRVIAAFPPNRRSDDLRRAVDAAFTIGAAKIRQAQLPASVPTTAGIMLMRPPHWC